MLKRLQTPSNFKQQCYKKLKVKGLTSHLQARLDTYDDDVLEGVINKELQKAKTVVLAGWVGYSKLGDDDDATPANGHLSHIDFILADSNNEIKAENNLVSEQDQAADERRKLEKQRQDTKNAEERATLALARAEMEEERRALAEREKQAMEREANAREREQEARNYLLNLEPIPSTSGTGRNRVQEDE
jgi:hypothetical protein